MKTCSLPLPKVRLRALALTLSIAGACPAQKTPSVASPVGPDASQESVPPPTALLRPDAARDAAPPPASKAEPIPELKFPGLTINARERWIDVDATVCLSEGALELIACNKEGKVHESIVAVEARPSHIHTALLLLGANNGTPAMRRPVNEAQTRWVDIPPTGDLIDVFLEFNPNQSDWGKGEFIVMRTTFEIDALDFDSYRVSILCPQGFRIYLNGHEIAAYGWWQDKPHYAPWDSSASQHLKAGTNTIAVYSNVAYDESTKASYGQVDCLIEGLKISDLD